MGAAFEALGRPLPPWRTLDAVAAKWAPKRFTDVPIADDGAACSGGALLGRGGSSSGGGGCGGDAGLERVRAALAALGVAD
jgi:hypothetical protein